MQSDSVTFAIDAAVAPELALAASALADGLTEIGRACEILVDPWPEALSGRTTIIEVGDQDHLPGRWRLGLGPEADLELLDPSDRSSSLPLPLPSLPEPGPPPSRILLIGGAAGRRTRMIGKMLEALRRHGGSESIAWRDLPDDLLRQRFIAEVHSDLRADELTRLLGAAAALVEVSDEVTPEAMLAAAIGRASGIPTVLHEGFRVERWEGVLVVSEWSGEAFADAAIAAGKRPRNEAAAAAIRRQAAERLAGAMVR